MCAFLLLRVIKRIYLSLILRSGVHIVISTWVQKKKNENHDLEADIIFVGDPKYNGT